MGFLKTCTEGYIYKAFTKVFLQLTALALIIFDLLTFLNSSGSKKDAKLQIILLHGIQVIFIVKNEY